MHKRIEKVAVLGAGTMGARISAHLANAGVPSYLLDIVPPDADGPVRNRIATAGLEAAVKSRPAAFFKPTMARLVTIITTNTSGLPVAKIVEGFPEDFRRNWFGTHFFNPPRYMRLLELIPTPDADPAAIQPIDHFCDLYLGEGVVY